MVTYFPKTHFNRPVTLPPLLRPTFFSKLGAALPCVSEEQLIATRDLFVCVGVNAGRSHSMKNDNSSFESVEEVKYLGTTLTNQNPIQKKIKAN